MKKILVNGAKGKMGQAIIRILEENPQLGLAPVTREEGETLSEKFDAVIDFSSPLGAQESFVLAKKYKKPFLTGTTNLPETFLFQMQEEDKIPVFFSPNVSLSVYFFTELVKQASAMYKGYQMALHEIHHTQKKDAPSGTAKKMADAIDFPYSQITHERIGDTVGTHSARFTTALDEITLIHEAKDRNLFADSAVHILVWLMKQTAGFYTMSDYAKFKLKENKK